MHCRGLQERLEALVEERKKISGRNEEANDKAAKGGKKVCSSAVLAGSRHCRPHACSLDQN